MEKEKIYISGPISGIINDNKHAFEYAKLFLKQQGWDEDKIVSPQDIPPPKDNWRNASELWVYYMRISLELLLDCEHVYMIEGWENSVGAKIEHDFAKLKGKDILYETSSLPF